MIIKAVVAAIFNKLFIKTYLVPRKSTFNKSEDKLIYYQYFYLSEEPYLFLLFLELT